MLLTNLDSIRIFVLYILKDLFYAHVDMDSIIYHMFVYMKRKI